MQDPGRCPACGAGGYTYLQNHLNTCEEARKKDIAFMNSALAAKRHGPALDNEYLRRRGQPPDPVPPV